jgi:hypothetical protein
MMKKELDLFVHQIMMGGSGRSKNFMPCRQKAAQR